MSAPTPALIFSGLILHGCAGSGDGEQDSGPGEPTFTRVHEEVLQLSCAFSSCHGGTASPLDLRDGDAHAAMVGVAASVDGEVLVIPFDPDGSYVVKKVENAGGIDGDPMPPSSVISDQQLALLRDWISLGALDD
jgi:hypothetical protein